MIEPLYSAATLLVDAALLYVLLVLLTPRLTGWLDRVLLALGLALVALRQYALWAARGDGLAAASPLQRFFTEWQSLLLSLFLVFVLTVLYLSRLRMDALADSQAMAEQSLLESTRDLEAKVAARTAELDAERQQLLSVQQTSQVLYEDQNTQLELAAKLQQATMVLSENRAPWSFATWFEPANRISGDLLRAEILEQDGSVRLFVGDAMGHSVAAAMLTMLVSASLEQIELDVSPAAAMDRMNAALNAHNTGMYVTGQLVHAWPDGRLCLSNAGHPPAILLRASGEVELLGQDGGFALGMFGVQLSSYTESNLALTPGDIVVFTTDGIAEMQLSDGQRLGDDGLLTLLQRLRKERDSLDDIVAGLRDELLPSWQQSEDKDDIAALLMSWNPGAT